MSNGDDTFIDSDGVVHERGWSGQYKPKSGVFSPERDINLWGQPNVEKDLFGSPREARGLFGQPIRSSSGSALYERPSTGSAGWGGSGGDDALAGCVFVLIIAAVGLLVALVAGLFGALFSGWRSLIQKYPRAMLAVHLIIGMVAVSYGLRLAGFSLGLQLGGALLVPAIWSWLWLTRRFSPVLMPINAILLGGALWFLAETTRAEWGPTWTRLTNDLPLVGNLPILLAVLPISLWLWHLGHAKWPSAFTPLGLLGVGALLWLLLMRVWTVWQTPWEVWMDPVPVLGSITGWLILLLPLVLWLWHLGYARYPLPFTAVNLLIFGALLGLAAYHNQSAWMGSWQRWMAGLPIMGVPILVISLSPITVWSLGRFGHKWPRIFTVPNLLLIGGILWLIADRTRPYWMDVWQRIWGDVPLTVDLSLLLLFLPLLIWTWRQGEKRWPQYWGLPQVILLSVILWWVAERTRFGWHTAWQTFAGQDGLDLAWLVLAIPLALWTASKAKRQWPRAVGIISWAVITFSIALIVARLFPGSSPLLPVSVALLPLASAGWLWLLRSHPRVAWPLTLLTLIGLAGLFWLVPARFQALVSSLELWLTEQSSFFIGR